MMLNVVLADVLKALCLGAKAVGLGRAFMYANSVSYFGTRGTSDSGLTPVAGIWGSGYRTYRTDPTARDSPGHASSGRHECERTGARDGRLFELSPFSDTDSVYHYDRLNV